MNKLFGTDGIRARAGEFPLDHSSVYALGSSLVRLLQKKSLVPRVVVGRDTRESGEWIEQGLFRGIADSGGEAVSVGVIPTSAVSFLTKKHSFSAGIVISASHNPYHDNGIKIFSSEGQKISEVWEENLENTILSAEKTAPGTWSEITPNKTLEEEYIKFLKSRLSHIPFSREITVVVDCANGASSYIAPQIISDLGFRVIAIHASPDGQNINAGCGSLHPQRLSEKVIETQADIGIAYDGDADRALWVDETGRMLNGDHTLLILSDFMKKKGQLRSDYIVATTMSNLGLERALEKIDLKLYRTQVGDKYVLEQMIKLNANLGGEQSGHTIFLDDCPTGDGILTSLKMLEVMETEEAQLSELVSGYQEFPQILENVPVSRKIDFSQFPEIRSIIDSVRNKLGSTGRLDLRYSGTEPLARIMIEGESQTQIEEYANSIAKVIEKHLGTKPN